MIPLSASPWLFDILSNFSVYVTLVVFGSMAVGLASKSMAVGALSGYITFIYIATETGDNFLEQIAIVTLVLIAVGFAFKFWRLEGLGGEP